jgi:hypothetical protein
MDAERYPIKLKRDLRVSSPQPVYRALSDLLEEEGYRVLQTDALELMPGALPGTATFRGSVLGTLDFTVGGKRAASAGLLIVAGLTLLGVCGGLMIAHANLGNFILILGILAGIILGGMGLGQVKEGDSRLRQVVGMHIEGESYQGGASSQPPGPTEEIRVERSGVMSNLRISVYAGVGIARDDTEIARWLDSQNTAADQLGEDKALPLQLGIQLDAVVERFALTDGEMDGRLE